MKIVMILGSALLFPAAAQAFGPPVPSPAAGPNAMVCQMVNQVGSRLSRHRSCMTRAEWDERHRQIREGINRSQTRQFNLRIDERVQVEAPR
ncbi:MAG: hypothetical protein QOG13_2201 [Sphingomonadales bacterium]|jgi:hypothetical protein|nr:hypothetical protein [Sphingomonadales bacterium]